MPIDGIDDLQDEIEEVKETAEEIDGENEVPIDELFPRPWMEYHTEFSSFEEFIEAGGWDVESEEDLESIPENEMDQHTRENTEFEDWDDMYSTAAEKWVSDQF